MRPAPWSSGRAGTDPAATFRSAVEAFEAGVETQRRERPELVFDSQPPPRRLAPYAAAIGATVPAAGVHGRPAGGPDPGADSDVAWGSLVMLYDPAGQPGWAGPFRIVAYVRAELEPEIAADPLIGQVGWTWLTEALDARTIGYREISGTITRVVTEGFGAKHSEPVATGFELRASWSPAWPAGPAPERAPAGLCGHVAAWCDALCAASGLPPLPAGVRPLQPQRSRRQP